MKWPSRNEPLSFEIIFFFEKDSVMKQINYYFRDNVDDEFYSCAAASAFAALYATYDFIKIEQINVDSANLILFLILRALARS